MSQPVSDPNPFAPPGADLETTAPLRRRIGWKIYFWVLTAFLVSLYPLLGVAWMQPLDVIDGGVASTGLVGLFGFAYRRRIGNCAFWRAWLPVHVLWDLAFALVLISAGLAGQIPDAEPPSSLEALASLLVVLPLYAALYLYGHRSPEVWASA